MLIVKDCMAIEDEVTRKMSERFELTWQPHHEPLDYADLVLNGCLDCYLNKVTDYCPLDERE